MDSILILPPTKTLNPAACVALEKLLAQGDWSPEWDGPPACMLGLNANKASMLYSRDGTYALGEEIMAIASQTETLMAFHLDAWGNSDAHEWEDVATLSWNVPGMEDPHVFEEACGRTDLRPRLRCDEIMRALNNPKDAARMRQKIDALKGLEIRS